MDNGGAELVIAKGILALALVCLLEVYCGIPRHQGLLDEIVVRPTIYIAETDQE